MANANSVPGDMPREHSVVDGMPAADRAIRLLTRALGATAGHVRIGTDACDIARFRRQLQLPAAIHFLTSTFTTAELEYCDGRAERIAARWAAKEAVAKAVGCGFRGLRPAQIEIRRHPDGAPYVHAAGANPWPHDAHTWFWSVSLGHEGDLAIAAAVAISTVAIETPPDAPDKKVSHS